MDLASSVVIFFLPQTSAWDEGEGEYEKQSEEEKTFVR